MGIAYSSVIGAWPIITSRAWETTYSFLLAFRLRECPLARATTYYFSTSGNNANDGLSTGAPKQTIAAAQAIHDAAGSNANIRFRFKRGDVWEELTGLTISKANVTVDDYGTGAKPLFNRFATRYTSTGWTQAGATDRWTRTPGADIAWVRDTSSRLGIVYQRLIPLSTPSAPTLVSAGTGGTLAAGTYNYKVVALGNNGGQTLPSANAAVAATTTGSTSRVTVSWSGVSGATGYAVYGRTAGSELLIATVGSSTLSYNDTGSLTPSGALPVANDTAEKNIEFTPLSFYYDGTTTLHINSGTGVSPNTKNLEAVVSNSAVGIRVTGNSNRVENIRVDGAGCHRTNTATQADGIQSRCTGTDAAVIVGCEAYYCGSHCITAYNDASGGIATFIRCKAGYTKSNGSGETIFNTYSNNGGQETIFHACEVVYGTLPSSDWYSASVLRRGTGIYGHTSSGSLYASLIAVVDCRATASNAYGCPTLHGTIPSNPVSNLVDCRTYVVRPVIEAADHTGTFLSVPGMVVIGAQYWCIPPTLGVQTMTGVPQGGWFINGRVYVDLKNNTSSFGMWNANPGNPSTIVIDHCLFVVKASAGAFRFDYDYNQSGDSYLRNSIVVKHPDSGSGTVALGLSNAADRLINNAYYNVLTSNNGYSNDAGKVELADPIDLWHVPDPSSPLYRAGNASVRVAVDAYGLPRDISAPDIGPTSHLTPSGAI